MFCRYSDNNHHPLYVLGPVKQEDEWDRPRIIRYHDILSNSEIEKVKELAKPRVSSKFNLRGKTGSGVWFSRIIINYNKDHFGGK